MSHAGPFTVALALAAGIAIQCLARSIRIPAIILLLGTGVVLGPVGVGLVRPDALGSGLFAVVDFAVAVILFEGALNLKLPHLQREERVIRRLLTIGVAVSLVGGAAAAWIVLAWSWQLALLFGSLVVVTGPTVVSPLVRDMRLRPRLQTILEAEGVLIDPVGALLAALVFQITVVDGSGVFGEFGGLAARIALGLAIGGAGGLVIAGVLRLPRLVHGYENALTLALVVFLFYLGDLLLPPSGLLAVTVAGLVVGGLQTPVDEDLREFKDQLTVLLVGAVFILLAANVGIDEMRHLGWEGAIVLAVLVLVVRPAGVWLATRGTELTARERWFMSAVAPRGIVAAAVTSLVANTLDAQGVPGGEALRAMVFTVIVGTVIVAGAVAWPLAAALGLRLPSRNRVAILGAQGLGLTLGRVLRDAGRSVVFIDTDPRRCRVAEGDGFQVVYGDGLLERTLRRVPIELVEVAIGATFNDHLNLQFARLAHETFGVPRALVSVDSLDGSRAPEHVRKSHASVLFDSAHDQERWDVRWRQGQVEVAWFEWRGNDRSVKEPASGQADEERAARMSAEQSVILAIERGGKTQPMTSGLQPRDGDRAAIAVYPPEWEPALARLAETGWHVSGGQGPSGTAK
jgi:NhaP-type Na+/H+ or K+/H+ antiporter